MSTAPRQIALPDPSGLFRESLSGLEFARLSWQLPALLGKPRGQGRRVLVLPGFGAGDGSTLVLRNFLNALGYRSRGWGLGRNDGDVPELMETLAVRVRRLAADNGGPVALVGWSLGGYLAREAARDAPEAVSRVITLGSPVVGGPKYTLVGRLFEGRGMSLDDIEREVDARYDTPLRVPVTAIYSKQDGVVAWQACIDERSTDVEHLEVRTSHIGLGFAPEVYGIIADRLAGQ